MTFLDDNERMRINWACADLVRRAMALSDAQKWEELALLYTEDGTMNRPGNPDVQYVGRAAILKAFRDRPPRTARHVIGNLIVDVLSSKAATASSTILLFTGPAGDGGAAVQAHGPILIGAFEDLLRHDGVLEALVRPVRNRAIGKK